MFLWHVLSQFAKFVVVDCKCFLSVTCYHSNYAIQVHVNILSEFLLRRYSEFGSAGQYLYIQYITNSNKVIISITNTKFDFKFDEFRL